MKRIGLIDAFALVIALSIAFGGQALAGDPGVGWHLATGRMIAESGSVPHFDPFLFAGEGLPWVANQWLADVVLWSALHWGGWPALHLLTLFLFLFTFFGVIAPLLKQSSPGVLQLFLVMLLVVLSGAVQLFVRPVIFSFLLFAVCYRIVRGWALGRPWPMRGGIWLLPPLFLAWANFHPAFPLGGIVLAAALAEHWCGGHRREALVGAAVGLLSVAAAFFNPYGLKLFASGAGLVGDSYFMNLNVEWYSVDTHAMLFGGFTAAVCIVLLRAPLAESALPLFDRLLLLAFIGLALAFRRYIPFCAIVAAVPLVRLLDIAALKLQGQLQAAAAALSKKEQRATTFRYAGSFLLLLLVMTCAAGVDPLAAGPADLSIDAVNPQGALRRLEEELAAEAIPAKIFHSPDWGGYITFKLWPRAKPTIDDRNLLNGRQAYQNFFTIASAQPGWSALMSAQGYTYALLRPEMPLRYLLAESENWDEIYRDDRALLFRRHAAAR